MPRRHGSARRTRLPVKANRQPSEEDPGAERSGSRERCHRAGSSRVQASGRGPAKIVRQELRGVDEHLRSVCDDCAEEGFLALAPDLYRGGAATQPSEAEQKMVALSMEQAEKGMRGAVEPLSAHEAFSAGGVAAVGFCLVGDWRSGRRPRPPWCVSRSATTA